jgi:hypothetical protein
MDHPAENFFCAAEGHRPLLEILKQQAQSRVRRNAALLNSPA